MTTILRLAAAALVATALAIPASAAAAPDPYVPFVTDFPTHEREAAPPAARAGAADGFDRLDAAFGLAAGLAVGALAAASLPAARRRRSLSSA